MRDMTELWSSASWRAEMDAWIVDTLSAEGIRVTAIREHRLRFWSVNLVVETDQGRYWAKEGHPAAPREPVALQWLGARVPEHIIPVTRADTAALRVLTPDAGPTLRTVADGAFSWQLELVRACARLQHALLGDVRAGSGLPRVDVRSPEAELESRLERAAAVPAGHPLHFSVEDRRAVRRRYPLLRELSTRLGSVPESFEHNDLHDGNAFVIDGAVRLADLGDAVIAHPFASLRTPYGFAVKAGASPAQRKALTEAYLEPWHGAGMGDEELRQALDAAMRLAAIQRFDLWLAIGATTPARLVEPYAQLLRSLLFEAGAPIEEVTEV